MSKLVLGTVQFGVDYWINNNKWKPSIESIYKILDKALKSWIDTFDTASVYWNSEEILWGYILKNQLKDKIKIISKFKLPDSGINLNIRNTIKEELFKSLNNLNIKLLDWYLLHKASDFYNEEIIRWLIDIKKEWFVKNIWVSIYEPKDAVNVSNNTNIDYIQIPYNILDQRLNSTNFFQNCKNNNIKIFARSVFLQGLILMKDEDIPKNLENIKPYLKIYDDILNKYKISRSEWAIQYILQNEKIDYLVFWVDDIIQLEENIRLANKKIDFREWILEIENIFKNVDKKIISPNLWNS